MIDWGRIETVLLDMDGTVLDLAFDNYFWREVVPEAYARERGLDLHGARLSLEPLFESAKGSLDWYCLEFWSDQLDMDIGRLKASVSDRIRVLPGALDFMAAVRASGRRILLVTNAHPQSLEIKRQRTAIDRWFDAMVTTHEFGKPKEDVAFWPEFARRYQVDLSAALFIDDGPAILRAARSAGVAEVVHILKPDSRVPAGDAAEGLKAVEALGQLQRPIQRELKN